MFPTREHASEYGIWKCSCNIVFCSDITTLAKDKIYTHINLEETTIHQVTHSIVVWPLSVVMQCVSVGIASVRRYKFFVYFCYIQALQYRDDPFSAPGPNSQRCHMCLRTDPLIKVLERLSQPGHPFSGSVSHLLPLPSMPSFDWICSALWLFRS